MNKLKFDSFDNLIPVWEDDENKKIVKLLNKKHSLFLDDESFEVFAGFNNEGLQIKVVLKKNDESLVYPVEAVCLYEDYPRMKMNDIAVLMVDYIDLYWAEYFKEGRDLFLPLDFLNFEYEELSFFMRGFVRKLSLEREADAFLKQHGHGEHEIFPISSET